MSLISGPGTKPGRLKLRRSAARAAIVIMVALAAGAGAAHGQTGVQPAESAGQPVMIPLVEAIKRAQSNEPSYASASAESRALALDRSIAWSGLLPGVTYHNQALYTQPNGQKNQAGQGVGAQPSPKFIANNAVREYTSQALVNETLGVAQVAAIRRADAASARAAAELEIARRGLVATVIGLYFGSIAADNKLAVAQRAAREAADFTGLTNKRESARDAAHADVVKAQLQQQQRDRDLSDAQVAASKARLELGVLLFADPRTQFSLVSDPIPSLASREEIERAAAGHNAELRSALAALAVSDADVLAARAAYLPDIGLNFSYGIDAPQFAVNGPDKVRNLGYSASVTVDIPVWDWLSTQHKVRQSEIRRAATRVALTAAQRRAVADLDEAYAEASAARDQLASLDASVQTATESLRLTRLRYAEGEATVLEVVDAESSLVTIENAREDGRVRYRAALASLQNLTGTM